jgi:lipopolysaccharide assembly protein A
MLFVCWRRTLCYLKRASGFPDVCGELPMRWLCFLFLVVFAGAAAFLAYENQQQVTLTVLNQSITTSVPILVGLTYLAGMLSGWTVVGMLRRSLTRVIREPLPGEHSRNH